VFQVSSAPPCGPGNLAIPARRPLLDNGHTNLISSKNRKSAVRFEFGIAGAGRVLDPCRSQMLIPPRYVISLPHSQFLAMHVTLGDKTECRAICSWVRFTYCGRIYLDMRRVAQAIGTGSRTRPALLFDSNRTADFRFLRNRLVIGHYPVMAPGWDR